MKVIFSLLFISALLFGGNIIVKDGDVNLSINGIDNNLQKDSNIDFLDGSTICYKSGNGRVVVNSNIQLASDSKDCIQTKIKDDDTFKKLLANLKNSFLVSFSNTSETIIDGVSSKGTIVNNKKTDLNISLSKEYLLIQSESSGPLPITLTILDKSNKIVNTIVNENESKSIFILSTNELKNKYIIKINDGFGSTIKQYLITLHKDI